MVGLLVIDMTKNIVGIQTAFLYCDMVDIIILFCKARITDHLWSKQLYCLLTLHDRLDIVHPTVSQVLWLTLSLFWLNSGTPHATAKHHWHKSSCQMSRREFTVEYSMRTGRVENATRSRGAKHYIFPVISMLSSCSTLERKNPVFNTFNPKKRHTKNNLIHQFLKYTCSVSLFIFC